MSKQQKQAIYSLLKYQGFPHKACIAILANISVSTNGTFNPKLVDKNGIASGLFQYEGDIKKAYYEFCKYYHLANCQNTQISFMAGTIRGPETSIIGLDNATKIKQFLFDQSLSVADITERFCLMYLKPKNPNMELRIKTALQFQKQGYK